MFFSLQLLHNARDTTMFKQLILLYSAFLCLMLSSCCCPDHGQLGSVQQPSEPLEITILHINDHHSHLDPEPLTLQLDTGHGKREAISVEHGGFPRLIAAIHERENASVNVIKMHSGDASTGDLYFTLNAGKADAAMMNEICFDTFIPGNHEFDGGDTGLAHLIHFLHTGKCQTKILSANIHPGAGSALSQLDTKDSLLPTTILERGGQKIGIIGLTVSGKTRNSSRPDPDTVFADEAQSAQQAIDSLRQQGINKIILSTHVGYMVDQKLAGQLSGVDVIVGGDSHSLLAPESLARYGLSPEGPYPTHAQDADGKPVCIVQAWQYTSVAGETHVRFDREGNVLNCEGSPWVTIGDTFSRPDGKPLTENEIAAIKSDVAASEVLQITMPDTRATAALEPYKLAKEELSSTVLATADRDLCLRRVPGLKRDVTRSSLGDVCNKDEHVNRFGGDVQQAVAEAFLQQGRIFFHADLSLLNGGGVRTDIRHGKVTVQNAYTVLPFKNTLVQLNARGDEIKAALEDALEGVAGPSANTGCYPYSGGLRWQVDLSKSKGSRISQLELRAEDGSYQPLDLTKSYKVITISFLADGGDSFTALRAITGERRIDVGLDYAEAFMQFIERSSADGQLLTRPADSLFSTQAFIDTP